MDIERYDPIDGVSEKGKRRRKVDVQESKSTSEQMVKEMSSLNRPCQSFIR